MTVRRVGVELAAPKAIVSAKPVAAAPPAAPATVTYQKPGLTFAAPADVGKAPYVGTPLSQAAIERDYKAGAKRDLKDPGVLKEINDRVAKDGANKAPVTAKDVDAIVDKADVKLLSEKDYADIKIASHGGVGNPATAYGASARGTIAVDGPYKLAKHRAEQKSGAGTEPTTAEVDKARADLLRIDAGAFAKPVKDVVYVNAKYAKEGHQGDPKITKIASHEMLHLVLYSRGVPNAVAGTDVHHETTGKLGWNQMSGTSGKIIPGETSNWSAKPGEGLPKKKP